MSDQIVRLSDLPAVFGLLDQMMGSDPFSAMAPFATGAVRTHKGRQHRPMALDVVELHVEDSVLTLSAEKAHEVNEKKEQDGKAWHVCERSRQFVKRSLRLPEYADTDNVTAGYENGVLKVEIPKKAVPEKKKTITIR